MANRTPDESDDIKRLLILLLLKLGATSDEIGLALGIDASAVRRLVPGRKIKKIQFTQSG
jgi:hypothetical protein